MKTVAKTFGQIAVPKMFLVKADSKENVIAIFYKHYCNFREETFVLNLIKIFYQVWQFAVLKLGSKSVKIESALP